MLALKPQMAVVFTLHSISDAGHRGCLSRGRGRPVPGKHKRLRPGLERLGTQECGQKVLSTTKNHFHPSCWRGPCCEADDETLRPEVGCSEQQHLLLNEAAPLRARYSRLLRSGHLCSDFKAVCSQEAGRRVWVRV